MPEKGSSTQQLSFNRYNEDLRGFKNLVGLAVDNGRKHLLDKIKMTEYQAVCTK